MHAVQRRHLALLFGMVSLRDPVGAYAEILALGQGHIRDASPQGQMIADAVARFIDELPATHLPGMVDVMRLLERVAVMGVKFPGSLIMLSKVMFTLDGILREPQTRTWLDRQGLELAGGSPQDFEQVLRADYAKWGETVRRLHIRSE